MTIKALVCDDDNLFRQMVCDILSERGVEVTQAGDGTEALQAFNSNDYDLFVTDFLMPRMDGVQVIQHIRAAGERGQIPIILMSAISKGHAVESAAAKPDYYVNKPFKPKKMVKLIDRILRKLMQKGPPASE